jgi:hypothetical protein
MVRCQLTLFPNQFPLLHWNKTRVQQNEGSISHTMGENLPNLITLNFFLVKWWIQRRCPIIWSTDNCGILPILGLERDQGCQMVFFHTKNNNFDIFLRPRSGTLWENGSEFCPKFIWLENQNTTELIIINACTGNITIKDIWWNGMIHHSYPWEGRFSQGKSLVLEIYTRLIWRCK